ncbi:MAG TPA: hypothetical protein VMX55_12310 [candidate division Zixibacteria bacterium]|nr:hypothetical protein [candidate division Zixibacteria bacterium]
MSQQPQKTGRGLMVAALIFGIINFLLNITIGVFIYWIFFVPF